MAIEIKQSYPTVLAGCLSGRVVAYWVLGLDRARAGIEMIVCRSSRLMGLGEIVNDKKSGGWI
ncbi:MAG: hypothetical protein C9356_18860 [Oleiphilus sp.]|nr:MAG: hypothetical protein C9356_18860 [Oleiphilus sp.]